MWSMSLIQATMQYKDKLKQADREAKAACIGLCGTIIVWALCGFGVSCFNVEICSIPLWILTGCGGTFLFAAGVSLWMAYFVMKDVGLDDEDDALNNSAGVVAGGADVSGTVSGAVGNAGNGVGTSVNNAAVDSATNNAASSAHGEQNNSGNLLQVNEEAQTS